MNDWIWAVCGYGLGAVPFGLILTRAFGAGDLRRIGSGNIGATNVLRTGRKGLAAATLLLDALKGTLAVVLARHAGGEGAAVIAGVGALVGHCFPLWLAFRGGKGVATVLGVALGLDWRVGLCAIAVWLIAARLFRISSVGGMSAAVAVPMAAWMLGERGEVPWLAGLAVLVVFQHRANIGRLLAGSEPRIGAGK